MYSANCKRRYLLRTALTSVLMLGGVTVAEEYVVASPDMAFGLQAKVQTVLSQQIDYEVQASLAKRIAQQNVDQMLADTPNIRREEIDGDTSLVANLPHNRPVDRRQQLQTD